MALLFSTFPTAGKDDGRRPAYYVATSFAIIVIVAVMIALLFAISTSKSARKSSAEKFNNDLDCVSMNKKAMQSSPGCQMDVPHMTTGKMCVDGACIKADDIRNLAGLTEEIRDQNRSIDDGFEKIRDRIAKISRKKRQGFEKLEDHLDDVKKAKRLIKDIISNNEVDVRGGDEVYSRNGYNVHVFKKSGHLQVRNGGLVNVLVVGGGGGGRHRDGGAGGGGGITHKEVDLVSSDVSVKVGKGGRGGQGSAVSDGNTFRGGEDGEASEFGHYVKAAGGGGGGRSRGGREGDYEGGRGGANGSRSTGWFGSGGNSAGNVNEGTSNNDSPDNGKGGEGLPVTIAGEIKYFGGGGHTRSYDVPGGGGNGGGGGCSSGGDGKPNTGGGGGGGRSPDSCAEAGSGGSGVVIVWYHAGRGEPVDARGGDEVYHHAGRRVHVFKQSGRFEVHKGGDVEVLVVGGGGGGGGREGGGGGAGGVIMKGSSVSEGYYDVVVGEGGRGGEDRGRGAGDQGEESSFHDITASGGGFGNGFSDSSTSGGGDGGSGGGGAMRRGDPGGKSIATGEMGHDGGDAPSGNYRAGGGGGGAGAKGKDGTGGGGVYSGASNVGGDGGVGVDMSHVFGTGVGEEGYFGGGGGGGANERGSRDVAGDGGKGGGGKGAYGYSASDGSPPPEDGMPNTGGGGGGGSRQTAHSREQGLPGGSGGSGVVIVRYAPHDVGVEQLISILASEFTETLSYGPGRISRYGNRIGRSTNGATIHMTPTFPTRFEEDCVLLHMGAGGRQLYIGVRNTSTTPTLRIRSVNSSGSSTNENRGLLVMDVTDFPQDGKKHDVILQIRVNPAEFKLWIDGTRYMMKRMDASLDGGHYTGTAAGSYGGGHGNRGTSESYNSWPVSLTGRVRFYEGQFIDEHLS